MSKFMCSPQNNRNERLCGYNKCSQGLLFDVTHIIFETYQLYVTNAHLLNQYVCYL